MGQIASITNKGNANLITIFKEWKRSNKENNLNLNNSNRKIIIIFLKKPMKLKMIDFKEMITNKVYNKIK